ncbi:hypothetical protein SAMN04489724_0095 [Algoriphagus locisalis]|uniref:Uncharacterized protein n=1 Tax=Algoriphagus locisalis TaxID=305507 RepID=A0A1I7E592_9BACT|nr:hypothetical protein SAMN04489724_0095 [Algoriphagus locisalis]
MTACNIVSAGYASYTKCMNGVIEIPLSKTKITLYFIGALMFVLLGIVFSYEPSTFISFRYPSPTLIRLAGIASLMFFGVCLLFITRKLVDSKIGLRISDAGIWVNSNNFEIGLIEWDDITGFRTVKISYTKLIIVKTRKPAKYIDRTTNVLAKRTMRSNHRTLGSPLTIMARSLSIDSDELEQLLLQQLEKRRATTGGKNP